MTPETTGETLDIGGVPVRLHDIPSQGILYLDAGFDLRGVLGATLYFSDYPAAVEFYSEVLGEPAYAEGGGTRGWRLGATWLTLLAGGEGAPRNVEVPIVTSTPAEAERLQAAFVDAGATGSHPEDQLMYEPVRVCPVTDPFGTQLLIYARLEEQSG